jgi:cell pole-organizing protein PopZ
MQDRQDPSMEDILASIKKVIAEEKELRVTPARATSQFAPEAAAAEPHEVLELDDPMVEDMQLPEPDLGPPLVSMDAAEVAREKLVILQQVAAAAPPAPQVNPLEAMVREMLRPVLKEWLDQHLPGIVDEHVKREISRITGHGF